VSNVSIFLYAEGAPADRLIEAWIADLGITHVDILSPIEGSWFGRFFGKDSEVLTLEQFWDKHRRLHRVKDIAGSLGILGATVSLAGIMITCGSAAPTGTSSQNLQQAAPQVSTAPSQTTIINIYGLANNIAGLVEAKTPEDALKLIQLMEKGAENQAASKPTHKREAPNKLRKLNKPGNASKRKK
jgi:hypothetical protein